MSLRESGLSEDVFGFYEALARLSTEEVRWIFVKAFARNELLGLDSLNKGFVSLSSQVFTQQSWRDRTRS